MCLTGSMPSAKRIRGLGGKWALALRTGFEPVTLWAAWFSNSEFKRVCCHFWRIGESYQVTSNLSVFARGLSLIVGERDMRQAHEDLIKVRPSNVLHPDHSQARRSERILFYQPVHR